MLSTCRFIAALICLGAGSLRGQTSPPVNQADSVRRAVQRFYDWYVPRAANARGRDRVMEAAVRGPLSFDTELVRWLRTDSTARARAKGEIDGLDGDPYLNAQDPCDAYSARAPTATDSSFLVSILGHGGCARHSRPDVVVEVARRGGRWIVLEFRDPNRRNEGLIPLLRRLHPRAK